MNPFFGEKQYFTQATRGGSTTNKGELFCNVRKSQNHVIMNFEFKIISVY
jgi:hypothetical protein